MCSAVLVSKIAPFPLALRGLLFAEAHCSLLSVITDCSFLSRSCSELQMVLLKVLEFSLQLWAMISKSILFVIFHL